MLGGGVVMAGAIGRSFSLLLFGIGLFGVANASSLEMDRLLMLLAARPAPTASGAARPVGRAAQRVNTGR